MPIIQSGFVTISCDGPEAECGKSVTFAATENDKNEAERNNPWLMTLRNVNTADKRSLCYCSDECEIKAAGLGAHNARTILTATGQSQVNLAALAAAKAKAATAALKSGATPQQVGFQPMS
jgi:hypothetical protein